MEIVDTHCHLDIERHFPDWQEVLEEARGAGVSQLVLAGVYRDLWPGMLEFCKKAKGVYAAPGLHPMYLSQHSDGDLDHLRLQAEQEGVVAIGEIGLDYHMDPCDKDAQQELFEAQLDIASACSLPVLLHVRKAHDQVLATLRRKNFSCGGITHAFNGSMQQAEQYGGLGFKIAVGGMITFERARKIRRVAAALPLELLVLETDSPDIPPASHYKERNRPAHLNIILHKLANIRNESPEVVARGTTRNAREILKLPALP